MLDDEADKESDVSPKGQSGISPTFARRKSDNDDQDDGAAKPDVPARRRFGAKSPTTSNESDADSEAKSPGRFARRSSESMRKGLLDDDASDLETDEASKRPSGIRPTFARQKPDDGDADEPHRSDGSEFEE